MLATLRNAKIRTISYVLIGVTLLAGTVGGGAALMTIQEVNEAKSAWEAYDAGAGEKSRILSDLGQAFGFGGLIHNFKNAVVRRQPTYLEAAKAKAKAAEVAISAYRALPMTTAERQAIDVIQKSMEAYSQQLPRLEQFIKSGATVEEIDAAVAINDDSAVGAFDSIDQLLRDATNGAGARVDDAVVRSQDLTYLTLAIVGLMSISIAVIFLWFARIRIIGPLYALMAFVGRVGKGDLTEQMANLARDEVGALGVEMNAMVTGLREIAVQTRQSVASLNSASTETLASTKQQAASVAQQFAAIQETTATLDEINQSGQQMTGRAKEIAAQAEKAHERSKDGLKAMDGLAQVMDTIQEQTESVATHIVALSEKTQAIGDIISTVNDIAERSQLLALNAAIEAAAAGEGGRSFSVVADEIKTLADQAKEATGQVSSILGEIQKGINSSVMSTEESVKRVANGREQAEGTLQAITALADTVEESVRAFDQIVASANQQRVGLEQVSEALSQIRTGSEQTAAGTRQIELAVSNINSLGNQLDHTMERYAA